MTAKTLLQHSATTKSKRSCQKRKCLTERKRTKVLRMSNKMIRLEMMIKSKRKGISRSKIRRSSLAARATRTEKKWTNKGTRSRMRR